MMILLITLGIVFALGLGLMVSAIFTAPEGFEDQAGFHRITGKRSEHAPSVRHSHRGLALKGHASAA